MRKKNLNIITEMWARDFFLYRQSIGYITESQIVSRLVVGNIIPNCTLHVLQLSTKQCRAKNSFTFSSQSLSKYQEIEEPLQDLFRFVVGTGTPSFSVTLRTHIEESILRYSI